MKIYVSEKENINLKFNKRCELFILDSKPVIEPTAQEFNEPVRTHRLLAYSLEQHEQEIRKPLEEEIERLKKQLDLNDKEHFNNALKQLRETDYESVKKQLEDEIEMLNNRNNSLMLELRATRYKFLEFQDSYVKQVADIISAQPSVLKFEDAKGLHNILRKQERQNVIEELEEWVNTCHLVESIYEGVYCIDKDDLKQKLKEMKGEKRENNS